MLRNLTGLGVVAIACILASPLPAQVWSPLGLQGIRVRAVALHPAAPETVYATARDSVYRSTDGGASFVAAFGEPGGRDLQALAIDPQRPIALVVGSEGNVFGGDGRAYFSTTGGRTWGQIPASGLGTVWDVAWNPLSTSAVFIASERGLFRATSQVTTEATRSVTLAASDTAIAYIGPGDPLGIGRSTDGGRTFQYSNVGFPEGGSLTIFDLAVTPRDPGRVFASDSFFTLGVVEREVHESRDSGATWQGTGLTSTGVHALLIEPDQGILLAGSRASGVFARPLGRPDYLQLAEGLVSPAVVSLAAVPGERVLAGTASGLFALEELPLLSVGLKWLDDGGPAPIRADPGESLTLIVQIANRLFRATGAAAALTSLDPAITVTNGASVYPDIPAGGAADNRSDPFTIAVDPLAAPGSRVPLELVLTSNAGAYAARDTFSLEIGAGIALLVDDDGGDTLDVYVRAPLDSLGLLYDVADLSLTPLGETVAAPRSYAPVIWMTGDQAQGTLTEEDQAALSGYLGDGGRLLLTGENIVEDLAGGGTPPPFLTDLLHAGLANPRASTRVLSGVPEDTLGRGLAKVLIQGPNGANNQDSPDVLSSDGVSIPFLLYLSPPGAIGGLRVEDGAHRSKAVLLGFGVEAVNVTTDTTFSSRRRTLEQIVAYLREDPVPVGITPPGRTAPGVPRALRLHPPFPNPFNPSLTIRLEVSGDKRREHCASAQLRIFTVRGEQVWSFDLPAATPGPHEIVWGGRDQGGRSLPSGAYLLEVRSGGETARRKVLLLR